MDFRERIPNIAALGREMGLRSYNKIYGMIAGTLPITAERAVQIETLTKGAIKRWEMRPDLWTAPKLTNQKARREPGS